MNKFVFSSVLIIYFDQFSIRKSFLKTILVNLQTEKHLEDNFDQFSPEEALWRLFWSIFIWKSSLKLILNCLLQHLAFITDHIGRYCGNIFHTLIWETRASCFWHTTQKKSLIKIMSFTVPTIIIHTRMHTIVCHNLLLIFLFLIHEYNFL